MRHIKTGAQPGGHFLPENFNICSNFQIILNMKIFGNAVCVRFHTVFSLSSEQVCIDSRNVINKYYIVTTPVEQNLLPGDYAW